MRRFFGTLIADQRVRFLAVGATNTLVGYLIFSALTLWVFAEVPFGYLLSLAISYAIAIVIAFVLYRRFVFKVTGHVVRDFVRFVSVYAVAIGINAVLLPVFVELLGLHPLLAQAITLVITTLLSFFGHRDFSFRRPGESGDESGDEPEDSDPAA